MIDEMKAVVCTSCGARLKVKESAHRVKCSKCNSSFEVAATPANSTSVRPTNGHPPRFDILQSSSPPPKSESTAPLGFFSFVWQSYYRTHSSLPFMLAMILGLLLMPTLSFLKPKIGVSVMVWSCLTTLAISVSLFVLLVMIATSRYLLSKQRTIAEDHRSWLSAIVCFLAMLTPALGIVAAAESFAPEEGLFVKLIPQFKAEQARLLGDAADTTAEPTPESDDKDSSSEIADTPPKKAKPKDTDDGSQEVAVADTKKSGRAKQTADKTNDADDGDQAEAAQPKKTAPSTKKSSAKAAATDADSKTKQVVAEGVGATKSEAEKDAFRNAVRQVVGAVVDAETLIKNDEVIEDKVLTYSDGFIKQGWETISEKTQGGLVRLKIKVEVEQRSVVAKLKAANVTMKQVDGKGLFAEVVTQLDAEKDAQALVEKALKDFPLSCLKAEVVGKPELVKKDDTEATIRISVTVRADLAAYDAFAKRFEQTLKGISKQKTNFTIKATPVVDENRRGAARAAGDTEDEDGRGSQILRAHDVADTNNPWSKLIPQLTTWFSAEQLSLYQNDLKKKTDPICIAINLQRTTHSDRSEWECFLLDSSVRQPLAAVSACVFTVKLSLLDEDARVSLFDYIEVFYNRERQHSALGYVSPLTFEKEQAA